jgi:DNA-binding CsgD family transcriptional regulator
MNTDPRPDRVEPRSRAVLPLSEAEVAATILDELLGYPEMGALRAAMRGRNPNLPMEDRLERARALASEMPADSLRRLFDRLGGPGPVYGSHPFSYYSESDRLTWQQRLISALFYVAILDPERDPDELLDAVCEQTLHLSGWRGVRLHLADHEAMTLTVFRDFRIRPLLDGRPSPQGTILRDYLQDTQPLPRSLSEPMPSFECWTFWHARPAVIDRPDAPIIKEIARSIPDEVWKDKTTIFLPVTQSVRAKGSKRPPIAVLASACPRGDAERSLSWVEPAAAFLEVIAEQLGRWVRFNLSRRLRQADLRGLSNREMEMLTCIGDGLSTEQTAVKLHISVQTVKTHRRRLREKLGIRKEAELVKLAIQTGLTSAV